jgi:ketosteroid isomerase-like protein
MKQLLWISLLVVAASCAGSENENVVVAKKMFDAFNRHDWPTMAGYYSESATFLDPSFGTEYVTKTREETMEKYKAFQDMFPDIHDEVVGLYPSGDKVIVEFVSTGNSGDSISFRLPIISVLTFKDGVIVKDATYYDLENP